MSDLIKPIRPLRAIALLVATALLATGCATRPPATDPDAVAEYQANNDPLEPTNRFLYRVNDVIDVNVLQPVARGYRYAVPGGVRRSIGNAVRNVSSPIRFANDVLQGHPRYAAETVTRFVVNSTVGLGGFFDVADTLGLPPHPGADFGTTLGVWGVEGGPFLFLPLLGPSNIRDATGLAGNVVLDPFTWASFGGVNALEYSQFGVGALDTRERLLDPVDQVKRDSLDPYATFRSIYRQNRAATIEQAQQDGKPLPPPHPFGQ
jgi:phospholipid-binding lipoprotein MlaA